MKIENKIQSHYLKKKYGEGLLILVALVGLVLVEPGFSQEANSHPPLVSLKATRCLNCHGEVVKKQYVHPPVKEESCDICHEITITPEKTTVRLADEPRKLCFTCHDSIQNKLSKKNLHPPAEEGCLDCHRPHNSPYPHLLPQPDPQVCASCHVLEDPAFRKAHGYQPVVERGCDSCHDAHGSDQEHLFPAQFQHPPFSGGECTTCHRRPRRKQVRLRGEENKLCFSCHADLEEKLKGQKVLHAPLQKGRCSGCHNPHLSDNTKFLRQEGKGLCFTCHPEIQSLLATDHPHPPAEEGCLDCHQAHGADFEFMLTEKTPDNCLACHDATEEAFRKKHYQQPAEKLDCGECHNPHGSVNETLLNTFSHSPFLSGECDTCHLNTAEDQKIQIAEDGGNELCLACHNDKSKTKEKPYPHGALETGECSGCHSPHASAWAHQLKRPTKMLCLECHDDRQRERESGQYLHGAIEQIGCEACHESHFSSNKALLLEKPNQLCLACHLAVPDRPSGKIVTILGRLKLKDTFLASLKKVDLSPDLSRNHPQLRHPVSGNYPVKSKKLTRKARSDLTFQGNLTCLSCHDAHAGASPLLLVDKLLNRTQLCFKCHRK